MSEQVILVAVSIDADTREEAQQKWRKNFALWLPKSDLLSAGGVLLRQIGVEEWWIAEDDRLPDTSDNDSAVFCTPGKQAEAKAILDAFGLTGTGAYGASVSTLDKVRIIMGALAEAQAMMDMSDPDNEAGDIAETFGSLEVFYRPFLEAAKREAVQKAANHTRITVEHGCGWSFVTDGDARYQAVTRAQIILEHHECQRFIDTGSDDEAIQAMKNLEVGNA